jgi:hypothetical protein
MRLSKKAQSTAEYAIVLGLIIAVVAGVMQVALKKGMMAKQSQAMSVLGDAGTTSSMTDSLGNAVQLDTADSKLGIYSQDWRQTEVSESTDKSTLFKGGKEERYQKQATSTEAVSVETLEEVN